MKKNYTLIASLLFLVVFSVTAQLPKKLAKKSVNLEPYFVSGSYYKGISVLDNILDFYDQQVGKEAEIESSPYYLMKASYLLAIGENFSEANYLINQGIERGSKAGKESYNYASTLLAASQVYLEHGYVKESKIRYDELKPLVQGLDNKDFSVASDQLAVKLLKAQGYFNEAFDLAIRLSPEIKKGISKYYEYEDPKTGKVKKKKYKKGNYIALLRGLAQHYNLIGHILLDQGNINAADSALKKAESYIEDEVGKQDIAYIENQYLRGLQYYYQENYSDALSYFMTASSYKSKTKYGYRYAPQTPLYYDLLSKITECYWEEGKDEDVRGRRNQFYSEIRRYFGKDNLYNVRVDFLDINKELIKTNFLEAQKLLEGLISSDRIDRSHPMYLTYLDYALKIYASLDEIKKAKEAQKKLYRLKSKLYPENCPVIHKENINKAVLVMKYDNDVSEAGEIFNNSFLGVFEKEYAPTHHDFFVYENSYADYLVLKEDYKGAIHHLKKGYDVAEKFFDIEKTDALAVQATKLAQLNFNIGQMYDAEEYIAACDRVYNVIDKSKAKGLADYLVFRGKYDLLIGDISGAEKNFKKAYSIIQGEEREKKKKFRKDVDISEFTDLYLAKGEYSKLEVSLLNTQKTNEAIYGSDHRHLLNTTLKLTQLYIKIGEFTKAGKTIYKAMSIAENTFGEASIRYTECLLLRAKLYAALGDYSSAIETYQLVLKQQEKFYGDRSNIFVGETLTGIAMTKLLKGQKDNEVYNLLVEAALIAQEFNKGSTIYNSKESPKYAAALKNLAYYHIETGHLDKALELLNKAEGIYLSLDLDKNNENVANIEVLKGEVFKYQGDFDSAIKSFNSAKYKFKSKFSKEHPEYVYALSKLGQIYYIKKDYDKAISTLNETTEYYLKFIDNYFTWLSESEKSKFWRKIKNDFEFYNTLAFKYRENNPELIDNVYDFTLSTKALLLNSSIQLRKAVYSSNDPLLIDQFNTWISLREELTAKLSFTDDQLKETGEKTKEDLEKEINDLEKELSEKSVAFSQNSKNSKKKKERVSWENVRNSLGDNEYAVEIVRYRYYSNTFTDSVIYAALIVSPETKKHPKVVMLPNGTQLEKKFIKYYQNTTKHHLEDKVTYDQYWGPIKQEIPDGATVYLSVEGVYNEMNVESLMNPSNKKYVLDENTLVHLSNTKDLFEASKGTTEAVSFNNSKATLVGNPSFYSVNDKIKNHENLNKKQVVKQLPGAEKEVKLVNDFLKKKGWRTDLLLYADATESKVKDVKNARVVHFATHGFFLADETTSETSSSGLQDQKAVINPLLKSGLVLKNGGEILEEKDIYDYNSENGILTAYEAMNLNLVNTELVVLSACETGLGDIQIGEGVFGLQRAFIVAGAETVIMSLFKVSDEVTMRLMDTFYKKWLELGDKREAFVEAKKEIKKTYPKRIYWGAFVMVGN